MLMGGLLVERILGTPKLKMHLCVLQNIFSSRHNVFQSFIVDRKIYVKNQLVSRNVNRERRKKTSDGIHFNFTSST